MLEELIVKYPNLDWDWNELSKYIDFSVVEQFPSKPWNWENLSQNTTITFDVFTRYLNKWCWYWMSQNTGITPNFVLSYPEMKWSYYFLSHNTSITYDTIKRLDRKPWKWSAISRRIMLTQEIIDTEKNLVYQDVSCNPSLTFEMVALNPKKKWDYAGLSYNKTLTHRYFIKYIGNEWDWTNMSCNESFPIQIACEFDRNWRFDYISKHCRFLLKEYEYLCDEIPLRFYKRTGKECKEVFDHDLMSVNKRLDFNIVLKYPTKQWNWYELSRFVPLYIVKNNPLLPWDFH